MQQLDRGALAGLVLAEVDHALPALAETAGQHEGTESGRIPRLQRRDLRHPVPHDSAKYRPAELYGHEATVP
ncbi:hypothetical protein GCM10010116_58870 [Microbispora rosea subsp. aerata]|nr:hypothetical protein GCM10010116_58870 [Microbispora rosea subsp. aerata]GIH58925.1 hypothetical protein Mro02_58390 [Microbispora rosea subsp. aerata]GLJ85888.1 hypothetical protein GCM10017588_46210 [Microbispora rosea subsp. aerata]